MVLVSYFVASTERHGVRSNVEDTWQTSYLNSLSSAIFSLPWKDIRVLTKIKVISQMNRSGNFCSVILPLQCKDTQFILGSKSQLKRFLLSGSCGLFCHLFGKPWKSEHDASDFANEWIRSRSPVILWRRCTDMWFASQLKAHKSWSISTLAFQLHR